MAVHAAILAGTLTPVASLHDLCQLLADAVIRDAVPGDTPHILRLIRDLAEYERAPDSVEATEQDIEEALFGTDPRVYAMVAEDSAGDASSVVGMALYFLSFSTWTGRHGLYLEDIFVQPECRSRGIGRALMTALAQRALQQGCRRVEWAVLQWNEPAIKFYRSLGATALDEWKTFRLSGNALEALGQRQAGD